jgi:hypothetical protein
MTTATKRNEHSHTMPISLPIGRQQVADQINASNDPRLSWRGFSFGGYWFSYYYFYFSTASPSSAARQMMPG